MMTTSPSSSSGKLDDILKELEERFGNAPSSSSTTSQTHFSRPPKKKKGNWKLLLGALAFVVTIGGAWAGNELAQQQQDTRQQAASFRTIIQNQGSTQTTRQAPTTGNTGIVSPVQNRGAICQGCGGQFTANAGETCIQATLRKLAENTCDTGSGGYVFAAGDWCDRAPNSDTDGDGSFDLCPSSAQTTLYQCNGYVNPTNGCHDKILGNINAFDSNAKGTQQLDRADGTFTSVWMCNGCTGGTGGTGGGATPTPPPPVVQSACKIDLSVTKVNGTKEQVVTLQQGNKVVVNMGDTVKLKAKATDIRGGTIKKIKYEKIRPEDAHPDDFFTDTKAYACNNLSSSAKCVRNLTVFNRAQAERNSIMRQAQQDPERFKATVRVKGVVTTANGTETGAQCEDTIKFVLVNAPTPTPTLKPTPRPTATPTSTPRPTATPTSTPVSNLTCNSTCRTNAQCQAVNPNWTCKLQDNCTGFNCPIGNCRLASNTSSTTCSPTSTSPTPKPTSPPAICSHIAMVNLSNPNSTSNQVNVGDQVVLRCAKVVGATRYQFMITPPNSWTEVLLPVDASNNQSRNYLVKSAGEHNGYCRPCFGAGDDACSPWTDLPRWSSAEETNI